MTEMNKICEEIMSLTKYMEQEKTMKEKYLDMLEKEHEEAKKLLNN